MDLVRVRIERNHAVDGGLGSRAYQVEVTFRRRRHGHVGVPLLDSNRSFAKELLAGGCEIDFVGAKLEKQICVNFVQICT